MKFYGLEIGCNKMLTADSESEILTVTTFGKMDNDKIFDHIGSIASAIQGEGISILPAKSPDVSKLPYNLCDAKITYNWHALHFKLPINYLKSVFKKIKDLLDPKEYTELPNK